MKSRADQQSFQQTASRISSIFSICPSFVFQQAFSCLWLYSSRGGDCGACCVLGWKQWMHHVEWIFAPLRACWTIITQAGFCSGRISITTLCLPPLHFDFVIPRRAVPSSAFKKHWWMAYYYLCVFCWWNVATALSVYIKGLNIWFKSPLWHRELIFFI